MFHVKHCLVDCCGGACVWGVPRGTLCGSAGCVDCLVFTYHGMEVIVSKKTSTKSGAAAGLAKKRPSRLGRGLSSLMSSPAAVAVAPAATASVPAPALALASVPAVPAGGQAVGGGVSAVAELADVDPRQGGYASVAVTSISPNPQQPRRRFEESSLKRLAASIQSEGMLQPVVVRPTGGGGYELVAGERRWRAAGLAEIETIPVFIKAMDDRQLAEWALIENLQREDLNPMERADAFGRLGEAFGLSHEQIAERVGLERSTVTNLLRLLKLVPEVREMVACGTLSMGQARALAGVESPVDQLSLAEQALKDGQSVRQVEAAVRTANQSKVKATGATPKATRAAYLDDLEQQISQQPGTTNSSSTADKKDNV